MDQAFYDALAAQQDFFQRMLDREMLGIELACRSPAKRRSLPIVGSEKPGPRLVTVDGRRVDMEDRNDAHGN